MTIPTPPYAALDGILRRARHLLLDFDGPLCTLYAHEPARQAADRLRAILATHTPEIPTAIASTADPLAVLAHAAAISPELAEQAEAELTRCELNAAATAQPTGYSHDVIASAREGHRTITVISTCSARAVHAYLDRASLDELVGLVVGRTGDAPDPTAKQNPIDRALDALSADPATCALVAESANVLTSARASGIATIAYARTPAVRNLTSAHADATVTSLADLVLRLRAHPLPN
jgi:beta-phosphoglucomutase-like phosphatase (HAD superfamily)